MDERMRPTSVDPATPAGPGPRVAPPASPSPRPSPTDAAPGTPRAAYSPPVLERLGAWRALTLQQSVPIFP